MAVAVKTVPRKVVTAFRQKYFSSAPAAGPPSNWQPPVEDDPTGIAAYRNAAALTREKSRAWKKRKLWLDPNNKATVNKHVVCEHCLRQTPVALIVPGIISRHRNGDWVCEVCDPAVAGAFIYQALLEEVVLEESS